MLKRSMAPANTTQAETGEQASGLRSRQGTMGRLTKYGRVRFEARPELGPPCAMVGERLDAMHYTGNLCFDLPIARQDRGHSCAAPSSQWRAPLSVSVLNGRRRVAPRSESHVQSVMLRVATVRIKLYVHVYLDTDRTPSGLGTQHVGRAVQPAGIAARAATAVAHEQTGSASIAACCRASCLKKMGLT